MLLRRFFPVNNESLKVRLIYKEREVYMTLFRRAVAVFIGTAWLVFGGCDRAALTGILYRWLFRETETRPA